MRGPRGAGPDVAGATRWVSRVQTGRPHRPPTPSSGDVPHLSPAAVTDGPRVAPEHDSSSAFWGSVGGVPRPPAGAESTAAGSLRRQGLFTAALEGAVPPRPWREPGGCPERWTAGRPGVLASARPDPPGPGHSPPAGSALLLGGRSVGTLRVCLVARYTPTGPSTVPSAPQRSRRRMAAARQLLGVLVRVRGTPGSRGLAL